MFGSMRDLSVCDPKMHSIHFYFTSSWRKSRSHSLRFKDAAARDAGIPVRKCSQMTSRRGQWDRPLQTRSPAFGVPFARIRVSREDRQLPLSVPHKPGAPRTAPRAGRASQGIQGESHTIRTSSTPLAQDPHVLEFSQPV